MLEATIFTLTSVGVPIAFGSTRYFTAIQNVGQPKSFVDDLIMERGTVSMRVAFVLRSAEVQPLVPRFVRPSRDERFTSSLLYLFLSRCHECVANSSPPPASWLLPNNT